MTEKELQSAVLEMAQVFKWDCYHTYDSRRSHPGFPDLVMVRRGRLIFSELKSAKGKLTPTQEKWLAGLDQVAETYVWRPSDWLDGTIEGVLR